MEQAGQGLLQHREHRPLPEALAVPSCRLLEGRPTAAKLFVCLCVCYFSRIREEADLYVKTQFFKHQQLIQHYTYIPCKTIKICLGPTSVPSIRLKLLTKRQHQYSCVSEYMLHMGSGRGSVKIQILVDDRVSNFLPNFKIYKLMIILYLLKIPL